MDVLVIVCIVCVSVCGLTAMATVLIILWTMPNLPSGNSDDMCLPKLLDTNGEIVCGPVTNRLSDYLRIRAAQSYQALVDAYYDNGEDDHPAKLELKYYMRFQHSDMRPRARLVAKPLPTNVVDNGADLTPFTYWHHSRKQMKHGGFKQYGVKIRNSRLLVPVAGLYDVYSFFVFNETCKDGKPDISTLDKPLKHAIFKFDILEGKETEIVSSVQPHKIPFNEHYNLYTSYMSSVVRLRAGDELSVKVSNLTYLINLHTKYFGITLI